MSDREYSYLRHTVGIRDLSSRGRLVLVGADRAKFLHGQVTNNVQGLAVGQGCYAALVTAKGKLQSDLHIYNLGEELLLDFESGLSAGIAARLEKYIIADDVQVVDAAPHYGLWSVQGPLAGESMRKWRSEAAALAPWTSIKLTIADWEGAEVYLMHQPRLGTPGWDLYVPVSAMDRASALLTDLATGMQGGMVGEAAWEKVRIEQGIPRYGVDMDESNLAPEAGLDQNAISYAKGCYIGQEVIARIRTYGQVAKALRGLRLGSEVGTQALPQKGDKLVEGDKEIGYVTSATHSPTLKTNVALAYVRREFNQPGRSVNIRLQDGRLCPATVHSLPFLPVI